MNSVSHVADNIFEEIFYLLTILFLDFIHLNNIKHTIKYYDWCEEIINGPISDSYWATQEKHIQAAHCWLRYISSGHR